MKKAARELTESLAQELLSLKPKTAWSGETRASQFQRVMGERGPAKTTLFRYATAGVKRRNLILERYVGKAIHKLTVEFMERELRESEEQRKRVEMELHQSEVRFHQLVENARDIIYRYRFHPNRGFEYISPSVTASEGGRL